MGMPSLLQDESRIALWGWGREGHAAYGWIRRHAPTKPLHLLATAAEVDQALELGDAHLHAREFNDATDLSEFAWVIKSPGISPYQQRVMDAAAKGTQFIGGTYLWAQSYRNEDGVLARTVCVTGTKGKSTTSALLAHLLRAGGHRTLLAGNIGLPLLDEVAGSDADYRVIELSSYQTSDLAASGARPEVAVVVNVFPEHLDWHGGEHQYVTDKLKLVTDARPLTAVLNARDPRLAELKLDASHTVYFGNGEGWHLRDDDLYRGGTFVMNTLHLPLPGRHNRGNLCAVLTAIEILGLDAAALAPHAASFMPLPNRLQTMGERDGIAYVNDSIATTPHATLAGLSCFDHADVALIVGGHDRGLNWQDFVTAMENADKRPRHILTMGQNGPAIHALLAPLASKGWFALDAADNLEDAVRKAERAFFDVPATRPRVILLSPGAPSFGLYRDYVERGKHFAAIAGFDPEKIAAIQGLGVS